MSDIKLIEFINKNQSVFEDFTLINEDDTYIKTLSNLPSGTILKYINKKTFQVHKNTFVKLHPDYDLELYNDTNKWEVHIYCNKYYIFYKLKVNKPPYVKKDKLKIALQELLNTNFTIKVKKQIK